jgi:hypothetical protein
MKANFMPTSKPKFIANDTDSQKYEETKVFVLSELSLIDSCMWKCSVNFNDSTGETLKASEAPCVTKCFNKFFDANFIADKELTMYTVGNPYVWTFSEI